MPFSQIRHRNNVVKIFLRWVFDVIQRLLFPVFCFGCNQEGHIFCDQCEAGRPVVPVQRCPFCASVGPWGAVCESCRRRYMLDGATVRGNYHEWYWRNLIKTWKYRNVFILGCKLSKYLIEILDNLPEVNKDVLIVPIPLSRKRQRQRGFNQAVILANSIADYFDTTPALLLQRTKDTYPQSSLTPTERRHNLKGAFQCLNPELVSGRSCVVVDDIITTGATLNEAAKVLKNAGAVNVWGIALARSDPRLPF